MQERIGHYRIVAELGRGGMGVVYKAHEESLNRFVALKVLGEHLSQDPDYVERFVREAQSAATLNHPNIVQVYAIAEDDGVHYFAMEYVHGTSIQRLLKTGGPMDPMVAAHLIGQASSGLEAAHEIEIIHRDIKPANLMVNDRGYVKIADFGLALLMGGATRLTATGMFMGTPGYLSPEQCLEQNPDHRTDLYSLGVTLYEMLTGSMPYTADSPLALIRQIVEATPRDVAELAPSVPDQLCAIVRKAMDKDREKRYQDAASLTRDLQRLVAIHGVDSEALAAVAAAAGAASGPQSRAPGARSGSQPPLSAEELNSSPTVQVDSDAVAAGADAEPPSAVPPPPPPPGAPSASDAGQQPAPPTQATEAAPATAGLPPAPPTVQQSAPEPAQMPEAIESPPEAQRPGAFRRVILPLALVAAVLMAALAAAIFGAFKLGLIPTGSTDSPTVASLQTGEDGDAIVPGGGEAGDLETNPEPTGGELGGGDPTQGDDGAASSDDTADPAVTTATSPSETKRSPGGETSHEKGPNEPLAAKTRGAPVGTGNPAPAQTEASGAAASTKRELVPAAEKLRATMAESGVAILATGEQLLAETAADYVRESFSRRGVTLEDARTFAGVSAAADAGPSGAGSVMDLLRPHVRYLVVVRAEYTGDRPLDYSMDRTWRTDVEFQGRLHVTAHDLHTGRPLGLGAHGPIGYTHLTVEDHVADFLRPRIRKLVVAIAANGPSGS